MRMILVDRPLVMKLALFNGNNWADLVTKSSLSYDKVTGGRGTKIQDEFQKSKRQKLGDGHILLKEELTPTIMQTFRLVALAPPSSASLWQMFNNLLI